MERCAGRAGRVEMNERRRADMTDTGSTGVSYAAVAVQRSSSRYD